MTYDLFRELLRQLGMDAGRFGSKEWNPLSKIVRPRQKILIKPNLVRHIHLGGGDYRAVVTHASLVRCALDYVALALGGWGEIVVGDAPLQSADFKQILEKTYLREVCEDVSRTWGIPVRLEDLRLWSVELDSKHRVIEGKRLPGDPEGYVGVDLGTRSLLASLGGEYGRFRVTSYGCKEMKEHHNETRHEYIVARSILNADVVINLPKLKTHRKVGLTAALKNVVGINGHKDWLPHHRYGSVEEGGDEYLHRSVLKKFLRTNGETIDRTSFPGAVSFLRFVQRAALKLSSTMDQDSFTEGSWYGNDTLWRTVLDLNRVLAYADKDGKMTDLPHRRLLTVVDGILAGEGEGPMEPEARKIGVLLGGINPVAVDAVVATMIGFDFRKIPLIARGFEITEWPLVDFRASDIEVHSEDPRWMSLKVGEPCHELCFYPPSGWLGHIEAQDCKSGVKISQKRG